MILVVCIDDGGGLRFNHRRQSRDAGLMARIVKKFSAADFYAAPDSAVLFEDSGLPAARLHLAADFFAAAGPGDVAFAEDGPLAPWAEKAEGLVIYHWNRRYPSDVTLDIDLGAWRLAGREDFAGTSHETITEEVYTR